MKMAKGWPIEAGKSWMLRKEMFSTAQDKAREKEISYMISVPAVQMLEYVAVVDASVVVVQPS